MAIPRMIGRWLGWALLGGALWLALSGCTQREESNPFLGPNGSAYSQPFG